MKARTVSLSGDTSALLFSALAAINAFWQWTKEGGITTANWDDIQALIDKANEQLMTPRIGDIVMYTTADAPLFSLPCDGEEYAREDYPDLYDVLDAGYIVDSDTFVTPGLMSRSPIGAGEGAGLSAYTVNQKAGEEAHQLTTAELAQHAHNDAGHAHFYDPPGIPILVFAPGEIPVSAENIIPGSTTTGYANIEPTGDDEPHNTIHPVNAVKFAVIYA